MVQARLRSRDADFGEQRQCPLSQQLSREPEMRADRLLELLADRVERIERAERILEHDADAPAADGAERPGRQSGDARARGCACGAVPLLSRQTSPAATRPGGSSSPMIARPVSDLPAPDSPTTPSTSPRATENDTSSTATSVPRRVPNSTLRSLA